MDPKAFGKELAVIVKEAIAKAVPPLTTRIEILEAEVRHGHEHIKALEGRGD